MPTINENEPEHNHGPIDFCEEGCPKFTPYEEDNILEHEDVDTELSNKEPEHNHNEYTTCGEDCPLYNVKSITYHSGQSIEVRGLFDNSDNSWHTTNIGPKENADQDVASTEDNTYVPGFSVIGEMTREQLIEEIINQQRAQIIEMPLDYLKQLVIMFRVDEVKKRLFKEANMDGYRPWGMTFGSDTSE